MSDNKNKKPHIDPREKSGEGEIKPLGWIGESIEKQREINKAYELTPRPNPQTPKPKEDNSDKE